MDKNTRQSLIVRKDEVRLAKDLRKKSIEDALAYPAGTSREALEHTVLWTGAGYEVGVGKPGKETTRKRPNPNDMWPFVRKDSVFDARSASFSDIFHELEHIGKTSPHALELLGCLFARSALMLDHAVSPTGQVIYSPPKDILDEIKQFIPNMLGFPLEVALQYIEAIALNEDVKYQTNLNASGKPYGKSAGRPNNLLTCAHLIAVLLGKAGMVDFAYGFSQQRGVSALNPKRFAATFPMLVEPSADIVDIATEIEIPNR